MADCKSPNCTAMAAQWIFLILAVIGGMTFGPGLMRRQTVVPTDDFQLFVLFWMVWPGLLALLGSLFQRHYRQSVGVGLMLLCAIIMMARL